MKTIYLFDVDGTLTPPRLQVDASFAGFFYQFTKANDVYLVSGSDYKKIAEQLPQTILDNCKGIFGCSGSEYVVRGTEVFRKSHKFPKLLFDICETFVDSSTYPKRLGQHIEIRPGMLNVSVVGRNATVGQRREYADWDQMVGERQEFARMVNASALPYEVSVGGEISVDIAPIGWNKSVVATDILSKFPDARLVFFGDKICPGGNDLPLAEALKNIGPLHASVPVKNYFQTWQILETGLSHDLLKAA